MPYDRCKVGNPILSKDGRQRIQITYPDGRRSVMSYPKYLMECYLGRRLDPNETVDHIDYNPLNNEISNLQVLTRAEHTKLDNRRLKSQHFVCPICGKKFTLTGQKLHNAITNRKQGKTGPFCTRSCAGKYGANIQNGRQPALKVIPITPSYTTLKLSQKSTM